MLLEYTLEYYSTASTRLYSSSTSDRWASRFSKQTVCGLYNETAYQACGTANCCCSCCCYMYYSQSAVGELVLFVPGINVLIGYYLITAQVLRRRCRYYECVPNPNPFHWFTTAGCQHCRWDTLVLIRSVRALCVSVCVCVCVLCVREYETISRPQRGPSTSPLARTV